MPGRAVSEFMMRDDLCGRYRASGSENKKPTWASGRFSSSGAFLVQGSDESRTSGVSPDPPWPLPARLAESAFYGRLVPDANGKLANILPSSRLFSPFFVITGTS